MNEIVKRITDAKNWADAIDDLHHDATMKHLRGSLLFARPAKRGVIAGVTEDRQPATSVQHEPSGSVGTQ